MTHKALDNAAEWVLIYEGAALAYRKLTGRCDLPPVSHLVWAAERKSVLGYILPATILTYLGIHFWKGVSPSSKPCLSLAP